VCTQNLNKNERIFLKFKQKIIATDFSSHFFLISYFAYFYYILRNISSHSIIKEENIKKKFFCSFLFSDRKWIYVIFFYFSMNKVWANDMTMCNYKTRNVWFYYCFALIKKRSGFYDDQTRIEKKNEEKPHIL
jgi:hypothetical protein